MDWNSLASLAFYQINISRNCPKVNVRINICLIYFLTNSCWGVCDLCVCVCVCNITFFLRSVLMLCSNFLSPSVLLSPEQLRYIKNIFLCTFGSFAYEYIMVLLIQSPALKPGSDSLIISGKMPHFPIPQFLSTYKSLGFEFSSCPSLFDSFSLSKIPAFLAFVLSYLMEKFLFFIWSLSDDKLPQNDSISYPKLYSVNIGGQEGNIRGDKMKISNFWAFR